ncbi:MAG TPA: hypothetical protein VLE89_04335 [Chlamydiales bacterium]|nr:hypothetical protein [Chlamydiales bacterium]
MVHGPQFPDRIGPNPEPYKPDHQEKTPIEPELQQQIDEVKEALQQELKAEEKLLGKWLNETHSFRD